MGSRGAVSRACSATRGYPFRTVFGLVHTSLLQGFCVLVSRASAASQSSSGFGKAQVALVGRWPQQGAWSLSSESFAGRLVPICPRLGCESGCQGPVWIRHALVAGVLWVGAHQPVYSTQPGFAALDILPLCPLVCGSRRLGGRALTGRLLSPRP